MSFLYKFEDKEIKDLLARVVIICDTREQENRHITSWLESNKIPYVTEKLDYGDYSCYLPAAPEYGIHRDIFFTQQVTIERKGSLGELSSNFTNDRTRIENELIRTKGKLFLLLENAEYGMIVSGKYPTQYKAKSFIGTLKAFEARYNIQTVYMPKQEYSGSFIYNTLAYHVREYLKGGMYY